MRSLKIEAIANSQDNLCYYCGHKMIRHQHKDREPVPRNAMTKDHIEPRVYGGETLRENLLAACAQCNSLRGEMETLAFKNILSKWFRRDESLRHRWHSIERNELNNYKFELLQIHERQLRGLARHWVEYAFRHFDFSFRERRRLRRAS